MPYAWRCTISTRIASIHADLSVDSSKLQTGLKGAKAQLGDFKSILGSAVGGLTGFNIAGLGAAAVIGGVASALKKSVLDTIAYNRAISQAAGATGMAVEEMGRFIQVADDYGISLETVTGSLQLATKNGFAPSLEAIAALADETNAMSSPTERAAYLAKILGRNWAALDPVLRSGGAAIKAAAAEVDASLAPTQAAIDKTEALHGQIDQLGDRWEALKLKVGGGFAAAIMAEVDAGEQWAATQDYRLMAIKQLTEQGINPSTAAVARLAGELRRAGEANEAEAR
ncbi:MAG: hypothetical protein MUO37_12930, partial [Methyloceanibacter sp.]|nr:hypothetical protein [Methyloceanibacter sp.]